MVSYYKVLETVYHCIASIINNAQLHSSVSELFSTVLCESVLYCVCLVYVTSRHAIRMIKKWVCQKWNKTITVKYYF